VLLGVAGAERVVGFKIAAIREVSTWGVTVRKVKGELR
jgi:hypothetical protein